jgi:hypothetical protein
MIKMPGILMIFSAGFFAACIAATVFVINPAAGYAYKTAQAIIASFKNHEQSELEKLQAKHDSLKDMMSKVELLADSGNSGSQWYAFIQYSLTAAEIEPKMINASAVAVKDNLQRVDYSIQCIATYHTLGKCISLLESGPYICGVEEAHCVSKSLLDNMLQIELIISFYRSAS